MAKDNKENKPEAKPKPKPAQQDKKQKRQEAAPSAIVFAQGPQAPLPKDYKARLKEAYSSRVLPALLKDLELKSPMAAPKMTKIVINIGVSEARENIQALDLAKEDLTLISGQTPQVRRAKKSISNFKLREGMPIGVRVTLRGLRMFEFFDRFVSLAVPRIRDFQGFDPRLFDGRGNLNIGLKEHHIFPEINMERSPKARGMNITFVTTAGDNRKGRALLENLGLPFRKPKAN
jgi:large subunit ribosomal protein L5